MPKLTDEARAERIRNARVWVNMTDAAMSGWGLAARGRSIYCIACDTREEADAIEKAAGERSEMKRVNIGLRPRKGRRGDVVTLRHVSELSGSWLRYMPA